MPVDTVKN